MRKTNNNSKKKILSITQILILLIGILAFNYIVGEIGKSQGIKVSRGIGIVGAQTAGNECGEDGQTITDSEGQLLECRKLGEKLRWDYKSPSKLPDTLPPPDSPAIATETEPEKPSYTYDNAFNIEGDEEKYNIPDQADKNKDGKLDDKETENWLKKGTGGFQTVAGVAITADSLAKIFSGGKKGIYEIFKGTEKTGELTKDAAQAAAKNGAKVAAKTGKIFGTPGEGFGGGTIGQWAGSLAGAIVGALLAWGFFKYILKADVRNMRDAGTLAIIAGAAGGTMLASVLGVGVALGPVGWAVLAIIAIGASLWSLFKFKNYSQEVFTYVVTAWKAKDGGEFCEKCNDLKYGCTEYQCKSFGKGCEIINKGAAQEACIWKNPNDKFSPVISALDKVLLSADYDYQPLQVVQGVKINYAKDPTGKGCIPPYTALTLGIETDEFAECKIDTDRTPDFENMVAPMTNIESFAKEHKLDLPHVATPSVENQQAAGILDVEITNGQSQEFFIRCEDANGNSNPEEFIMEFCVQDGPDTSAPTILGTNFLSYLQYNQTDTYLEVYTNEPAECKWSPEDLDYDSMQFDMSQCSMSEGDYLFGFGYGCKGTLTGLKDRMENKVYIKCKDKPWWTQTSQGQRYANENSFVLNLIGTEPLVIDKITINGKSSGAKIKDSTETIKAKLEVTAKFGAQQGKAKCEYESGGNFVGFYNEGDTEFVNLNTQNLYLAEGDYNISIKCSDAGGNSDKGNIEFSLEKDRDAPIVARAYYDVNNLKVITNEPAECVYTLQQNIGCAYEFKDGTAMSEIGELTHYTSWQAGKKYFIKCKDAFGNRPLLPNQCSIIVKAFESYK